MKFNLKENVNKILYHGSQSDNLQLKDGPMYLTDDKKLAINFAKGYAFNYDLYESDRPTVYEMEVNIVNPKVIKTDDEYDNYMDISNSDWAIPEMEEQGYDGCVLYDDGSIGCDYYMVFNSKEQCKIINKTLVYELSEEFPGKQGLVHYNRHVLGINGPGDLKGMYDNLEDYERDAEELALKPVNTDYLYADDNVVGFINIDGYHFNYDKERQLIVIFKPNLRHLVKSPVQILTFHHWSPKRYIYEASKARRDRRDYPDKFANYK